MKFLRHLLSHIMFMILIIGIVMIYYFRSQVMPAEYVEIVEHYAEEIHPAVLAFKATEKRVVFTSVQAPALPRVVIENQTDKEVKVTEQYVEKDIVIPDETNEIEIAPVVEKDEVVEKKTDVVVKESVIPALPVVSLKSDQAEKTEWVAGIKVPVIAENKNDVEKSPPEKDKEVIETIKAVAEKSSDVAAADYKLMLQTARSLFQSKKYKESISKYKELIELENHEADFHGELGNVYYGAGNWHMAGEAYYEAAVRLMDKGDYSQVSYLHRVLQGLDKDRAYKLAQKISEKNQEN